MMAISDQKNTAENIPRMPFYAGRNWLVLHLLLPEWGALGTIQERPKNEHKNLTEKWKGFISFATLTHT